MVEDDSDGAVAISSEDDDGFDISTGLALLRQEREPGAIGVGTAGETEQHGSPLAVDMAADHHASPCVEAAALETPAGPMQQPDQNMQTGRGPALPQRKRLHQPNPGLVAQPAQPELLEAEHVPTAGAAPEAKKSKQTNRITSGCSLLEAKYHRPSIAGEDKAFLHSYANGSDFDNMFFAMRTTVFTFNPKALPV